MEKAASMTNIVSTKGLLGVDKELRRWGLGQGLAQKLGKERYLPGYRDDMESYDYDCMSMVHRMLAAENRSRGRL